MENELKPCPLCGANDVKAIAEQVDAVSWHGEVECVDCEMRVSIDVCEPTPERAIDDAIEIWNRRAALPFDAALAPEGWKLAPVEPTVSMVVDGFESDFRFRESPEFAAMAGCKGAAEAAKVCYRAMLAAAPVAPAAAAPFQQRVQPWLMECFGPMIAGDREERNHRFLEEALELVQACGCTAHEAHQLVDYTFGRAVGEPTQEVGGVMVTLAALCLANGLDMHVAGETELARISVPETVAKIRAKQAAKPKHSPLPAPAAAAPSEDAYVAQRMTETLAEVYATIIGDDARAEDESLNAIERVKKAAQVLRLEVDLYRAHSEELASTKSLFLAACADLGAINEALGLDPEDGGAEPILEAIAELKGRTAPASAAPLVAAGLTDEQREALTWAAERASRDCLLDYRKALNAVLAAAPKAAEKAPVVDAAWGEPIYQARLLKAPAWTDVSRDEHDSCAEKRDQFETRILCAAPAQQAVTLTDAARDVLAERRRQVEQEGRTPAHDDQYQYGQMATAAGCYAMFTQAYPVGDPSKYWPWAAEWWKPTTPRRNLVKAGALILAEIERLDRAVLQSHCGGD